MEALEGYDAELQSEKSDDMEWETTAGGDWQEERFEGSAELMGYRTEFAEDGVLNTLMLVPEEMRQEAAKHGVEVREDGYAAIESTTWKEVDGKFYYDTGIQGETLGEPVDPFAEISVTEDGCLLYGLGMILLERA